MNMRKFCIRLLLVITAATAMFCVNFFIGWSGNIAFNSMLNATMPFIGIASVCWLAFGIIADRIQKENAAKRKAIRKRAMRRKENIIYLDSLIALGYYKKAC